MREIALVFLLVAGGTVGIAQLDRYPPAVEYVGLAIGAFYLAIALLRAQREKDGARRYGIDLGGLLAQSGESDPGLVEIIRRGFPSAVKEIAFALLLAAIVFPPFAVGFYFWNEPRDGFELYVPPDIASFALTQLVVVALPEEALFRGYFQTRLTDVWPKTHRVLGADVSIPALVAQAALFAILHFLVEPRPDRLAVFFPGLVFGWMRARRDGIGAGVVFHALCNVYSDLLFKGFFR